MILALILPDPHKGGTSADALRAGVVIAVLGLIESVVVRKVMYRDLPCDPGAAVAVFRTRFFLFLSFACSPALFGFVFSFLSNRWWVFLFGLAPTLLAFAGFAPTRAAIEREQAELAARDCQLNLLATLMQPPPAS